MTQKGLYRKALTIWGMTVNYASWPKWPMLKS